MAGSAATENYNAAGNSDFSRKAMELIEASEWLTPNVPNGGRTAHHAEVTGKTAMHNGKKVQLGLEHQSKEWAAPQARDHFPAHTPEYVAAKKAEGHGMRNLNDEAADWRSPASQDAGITTERLIDAQGNPWTPGQRAYDRETGRMCQTGLVQQAETFLDWRSPTDISKRGGSQPPEKRMAGGHTVNLEDQAEHWPPMNQVSAWPGPAARDHKGSSPDCIIRQDGRSRADMLDFTAEQFFNPPSFPDPATPAGENPLNTSPNTNRPSVRRKLNPYFVEALMRWPTGLSGFERPETESILSPQHGPSSAYPRRFNELAVWWAVQAPFLAAMVAGSQDEPQQMTLF